jgi:hypothetical protein
MRLIIDGGDDDRATFHIYSLMTQVLCAKSVPRADAGGIPLLREAGPYAQGLDMQSALTSGVGM